MKIPKIKIDSKQNFLQFNTIDNDTSLKIEDKLVYSNIIEVGEINTIQKAVDLATPYTKIILPAAIFKEYVIINKPHLEIESRNPIEPAIIISDEHSCFKIDNLKSNEIIKLKNLKMMNRGIRKKEINDLNPEDDKMKTKNPVYSNSNLLESIELNLLIDQNVQEGIVVENRGRISGISIYSGILMIMNCQITLAYITSYTNTITMGVYAENCCIFLDTVLIKGNRDFLTVGVFSYYASTKLNNCKLINHKSGGLLCMINEMNYLIVCKSIFQENVGSGMYAKGEGIMDIEDNLFEKTQGNGARISNCKKLKFVSNKSIDNHVDGAEFINCNGVIMLNYFYKNRGNGVSLSTEEPESSFTAKFTKNSSIENGGYGVCIKGIGNIAQINYNDKICYNTLAGIQIKDKGTPNILNNTIYENMGQGILITSGSSAIIIENKIYRNIKANIAFGGVFSEETKIINNKIFSGRCEGIFCIEGKIGEINKNEIYENFDGIILVKSECVVVENIISKNKRSGVMICELSKPKLMMNSIFENKFIGVLLRDRSHGVFKQNIIKNNLSQIYFSYNCKQYMDEIIKGNFVEGRHDYEYSCNIF